MITIGQARAILAGLPDAGHAVLVEMARRRHLEAHRLLTLALGDSIQAKGVVAALIKDQIMKR